MTPTQPPALLPCPFCGRGAHFNGNAIDRYCVNCDNPACYGDMGDSCGQGRNFFPSEQEAAIAWNRRATEQPPAHDDLRARLPELPEATELNKALRLYTAEQMRDYAIAALSALPEAGEAVGKVVSGFSDAMGDSVNVARWTGKQQPEIGTLLYTTPQPAPAAMVEGLRDGDVHAIACVLAREDGYDPADEHGGLYDLRWSGGPNPEPEGDAWNMDYMPKAERIAKAIGYRATPTQNTAAILSGGAVQGGAK